MRKGNTAGMHIAYGSKPQTIQLPKTITKTLAHLVQVKTGNFVISMFPSGYAQQNARRIARVRIAFELASLRLRRLPAYAHDCQGGAVKHGGLPQILNIDRVFGSDRIKLGASRQPPLGKLYRCPTSPDNNPTSRRLVFGSRG